MTTLLAVAFGVWFSAGPGDPAARDLRIDCLRWGLARQIVAATLPDVTDEVTTQEEALLLSQGEFRHVVGRAEKKLGRDPKHPASDREQSFLEALAHYRETEQGVVPTTCRGDLLNELALIMLDAKAN